MDRGVRTERQCDREGLSLRIEIIMNGGVGGEGWSVHTNKEDKQFFTHTYMQLTLLAMLQLVCDYER